MAQCEFGPFAAIKLAFFSKIRFIKLPPVPILALSSVRAFREVRAEPFFKNLFKN
jgi:hypothetical protein